MNLEELKKEYATQDNRMTAYPIYVTVQELSFVGVIADGYSANCPYGYSANCPYGDSVTKIEYGINYDSEPSWYDTLEEAKDSLKEQFEGDEEDLKEAIKNIQELNIGYVWHPIEFFLTIKDAEEYMRLNKHNHGKLRAYVHWFERRNFEMRGLLEEIGFKEHRAIKDWIKFGHNQALDLIGNKEIGLDVGKILNILNGQFLESKLDYPHKEIRELKEIKELHKNIVEEKCGAGDELHCTCVPALRSRIEKLEETLKKIAKSSDIMAGCYSTHLGNIKIAKQAIIKELGGEDV